MKNVYKRISIYKYVGLKSKMHSIVSDDGKESNTAKRINTATDFNEFKDTLFNEKVIRHKMKRIQSKKHKIETYEINKISLPCFDDKRFVLDDGIHTCLFSCPKKKFSSQLKHFNLISIIRTHLCLHTSAIK